MINAQITKQLYRYTMQLADLNLNISVNTRECFRLSDFGVTLRLMKGKIRCLLTAEA
jgi:hypothetical protein